MSVKIEELKKENIRLLVELRRLEIDLAIFMFLKINSQFFGYNNEEFIKIDNETLMIERLIDEVLRRAENNSEQFVLLIN